MPYAHVYTATKFAVTAFTRTFRVRGASVSLGLQDTNIILDPRVYPKGSLVIALVRPCVRPSLDISETVH